MAIVAWSEYLCPHCERRFGEADIISAYHSGMCPACKRAVKVDAKAALARGPMAALIAIGVVGAAALVWTVILGIFGIDSSFFQSRSWPEPKFTAGIVPVLLLALIVASTGGAAILIVKAYVKARLGEDPR